MTDTKAPADQAGKPSSTNPNAPATAKTGAVENKNSEPAKNPAPDQQSLKPVVTGAVAVKDPDGGPTNPVNENAAAEKAKADEHAARMKEIQSDAAKQQKNEEEAALNLKQAEQSNIHQTSSTTETDSNISAREQAELDKALGDKAEFDDEDDDDAPALSQKTPEDFEAAATVVKKLLAAIPASTPDEHTVWGAGGVVLNLGHLRSLAKYMK